MDEDKFDFDRYIKQYAHADLGDFAKDMLNDQGEAVGINEFLNELQAIGSAVIKSRLTDEKEVGLFIATMMGQITSSVRIQNPVQAAFIMDLIYNHKEVLVGLVTVALACGIGISVKEEWR